MSASSGISPPRRSAFPAVLRALVIWCPLSIALAFALRALGGGLEGTAARPDVPAVEGILLGPYFAIGLFMVPGLVFVTTAFASIVDPAEIGLAFDGLPFALIVGALNGILWAAIVAVVRSALRRRRLSASSFGTTP